MSNEQDPAFAAAQNGFRTAFDTCLDAVRGYAVLGESRQVDPSMRDIALHPFGSMAEEARAEELIAPIDEHRNFAGLADCLTTFDSAMAGILFPEKVRAHGERVRAATQALCAIARVHANQTDAAEPSQDHAAAHEFLKAMNEWEDATADLAAALDL